MDQLIERAGRAVDRARAALARERDLPRPFYRRGRHVAAEARLERAEGEFRRVSSRAADEESCRRADAK